MIMDYVADNDSLVYYNVKAIAVLDMYHTEHNRGKIDNIE